MKLSPRMLLWTALLAGLFLWTEPGRASADVVHLRTGESIKGREVREETNEEYLVIEDFVRGSVRRIRWEAVDPADKDRIWTDKGWKDTAAKTLQGDVIVQRLGAGQTGEVRGVVEREDADKLWIRQNGQLIPMPKSQVAERRKEEMDARDVWSPAQLWDKYVEDLKTKGVPDLDAADTRAKWNAAAYAKWCDHLERARELYEAVSQDTSYGNAKVAEQRLQEVVELIRDAEARKSLKQMRMLLAYKNFRKYKLAQTAFAEQHPNVGEAVKVNLERLNKEFETKRDEYFRAQARSQFPKIAEKLIEKKVKEKDITVTDVTSWTRRTLPEDAFKLMAERFSKKDDITPEDAQAFWEQRKKSTWLSRSYGAGTFVVKPAKVKPPSKRRGGGAKRRQPSKAAPKVQVPKPPTREQWWARAKTRQRTAWAMAYFAERSGLFEVGPEKLTACRVCGGLGLESKTLQSGGALRYLCTRCAGTRNDWTVRFR